MRELDHDRDRGEKITSLLVAALVLVAIGIYMYIAGTWNPLRHAIHDNDIPSAPIIHLPSHTPRPTPQ